MACGSGRAPVGRKPGEANAISLGHADFETSEGDLHETVSK